MKSLIFKFAVVSLTAFPVSVTAAGVHSRCARNVHQQSSQTCDKSQMEQLIDKSVAKIKPDQPETIITCVSEMERIEAVFPDSVQPKYHIALQSLSFAVQNPQDAQAQKLMDKAQEAISEMEQMKNADASDICTLLGFLYMTKIVQNPMQNGALYYREVIENYEKALKINPENELARQLYDKFKEGMRQAGL